MNGLPPAESLAYAGMGLVGLYGVWKTRLSPLLARRRAGAAAVAP